MGIVNEMKAIVNAIDIVLSGNNLLPPIQPQHPLICRPVNQQTWKFLRKRVQRLKSLNNSVFEAV